MSCSVVRGLIVQRRSAVTPLSVVDVRNAKPSFSIDSTSFVCSASSLPKRKATTAISAGERISKLDRRRSSRSANSASSKPRVTAARKAAIPKLLIESQTFKARKPRDNWTP